jgi:hypothetical protein
MFGLYGGGRLLVFFLLWLLHWYDELKLCFCMGCAPVWMDSILPVLNVWLFQRYRLYCHFMVLMKQFKDWWNLISHLVGSSFFD